jgi:hypothetical protein
MTSDSSHAFRRCPWIFYIRFHSDKSDPMQPSRQAFEGVQTLPSVEKLMPVHRIQMTGQHRLDTRSSFPSPSSIWISEKTLIRKVFYNRPDALWCSKRFQFSFTDAERNHSCDRPDASATRPDEFLIWEAFSAILERQLQLTVRTVGQAVQTPLSVWRLQNTSQYFYHNFLLKYRIETKLVSLES